MSVSDFFKWRQGVKPFALALILLGLLPLGISVFSDTLNTRTVYLETHWVNFSTVGFLILLSYFFVCPNRFINKRVGIFLVIILIGVLAFITRMTNVVWQDEETFCTYWLQVNPHDQTAKKGRAEARIRKYDKGLEPQNYKNPGEVAILVEAFQILGDFEKAQEYHILLNRFNLKKNQQRIKSP